MTGPGVASASMVKPDEAARYRTGFCIVVAHSHSGGLRTPTSSIEVQSLSNFELVNDGSEPKMGLPFKEGILLCGFNPELPIPDAPSVRPDLKQRRFLRCGPVNEVRYSARLDLR